ncbi:DNA-3-methyladenine glycosylase 2 family protein [Shewanella maritima]|uniref:DNA-3-methyladenine glycosylase 2 family protein n=1 Tax=Shewanella maritima TaxID=2520507 RepID=UPI0037355D73
MTKSTALTDCQVPQQVCRQARLSRDPRFDGKFFTGVLSTGIYCRSICPATAPLEKNVRYFDSPIQASNAGLRPCLRCRPDSAPHSPAWLGVQTTVHRAVSIIESGYLQGETAASVTDLATRLGISSRYLSQLFNRHIGCSPKQYALYQQLMFAKQLLVESQLSVTDIASASGFSSIRRFNEAFKQTLQLTPSQVRKRQNFAGVRNKGNNTKTIVNEASDKDNLLNVETAPDVSIALSYRPPFDWQYLIDFYKLRQINQMEWVSEGGYQRTFDIEGVKGLLCITHKADKHQLQLSLYLAEQSDISQLMPVIKTLRRCFDLDADMQIIDANMAHILNKHYLPQSIRIPGVPSAFEAACRAVLGQQVSVKQATNLVNTLVKECGQSIHVANGQSVKLFPTPKIVANADLSNLKMPASRHQTLRSLAQYIVENPLAEIDDWLTVKGIGPWTVAYTKMRGCQAPDILLSGDLIVKNTLKSMWQQQGRNIESNKAYQQQVEALAKQISPWGSYLTLQLWHLSVHGNENY